MAKPTSRSSSHSESTGSSWDQIGDKLEFAPRGLHQLAEPTIDVPLDWPSPLVELYLVLGGGELFLGELVISAPTSVVRDDYGWRFAAMGDDALWVVANGAVLRGPPHPRDRQDLTPEGTSVDRWLHGTIDALGLLFDRRGEYVDFGEESPNLAMARAQLKRDAKAPGPRWRLARALTEAGDYDKARDTYEDVAQALPNYVALWLDMAQLSEIIGDDEAAYEEALTGATLEPATPNTALAWASVARLALTMGHAEKHAAAAQRFALLPGAQAAFGEIVKDGHAALANDDQATAQFQLELAQAVSATSADTASLAAQLGALAGSPN